MESVLIFKRGCQYLLDHQNKDGSFLGFSTKDLDFRTKEDRYSSVFISALILSCLNTLKDDLWVLKIKKGLSDWLLKQRSSCWSFNYWERGSNKSKQFPYPDDLDDTFITLSALFEADKKIFSGDVLAKITQMLISVEKEEGGPFKTWLVAKAYSKDWQDVDLVVNSNIGFFLSLQKVSLPKIEKLIESAIDQKTFFSKYYPKEVFVLYFIIRFYRGKKIKKLFNQLLFYEVDKLKNVLEHSLFLSTLLNVEKKVFLTKAKRDLLHTKILFLRKMVLCNMCQQKM